MLGSLLWKCHQNAQTPPKRRGLPAVCKPRWFTTACIFFFHLRGATWFEIPDRFFFTYRTSS